MKLPHWVLVALSGLSVVVAWMMQEQKSGSLTLPAIGITLLTAANLIVGLLAPSIRSAGLPVMAKRGFAQTRLLMGLTGAAAGGVILSGGGCVNGKLPPGTVPDVNAGVQLALCVINGYAADTQAGMSAAAITLDLVAKCGTDAATIAVLLDAQARAEHAKAAK